MTNCKDELIKGIVLSGAGAAGVGTAVDIAGMFGSVAVTTFNEITVFNNSDKTVKAEWTNDSTGGSDFFLVPNGGASFTHKLGKGYIATVSLKVYSVDTAATGDITINLSRK